MPSVDFYVIFMSNIKFCNYFFVVSKLMVKPALQMMSSSERRKEIELRELMMSKTSSSVPSLSIQCEKNQKKAHAIQAQV